MRPFGLAGGLQLTVKLYGSPETAFTDALTGDDGAKK